MNRTFNNGIGMVVVVDAANAQTTAWCVMQASRCSDWRDWRSRRRYYSRHGGEKALPGSPAQLAETG
jgi:hypothetical protein